jgi:hypothetical protein
MDTETLLAGGAVSMFGIEAASRAAAFLKKQRCEEGSVQGAVDDADNDDVTIPYTVDDNKGSILCFQESVFYISNSHLSVTLLDNLHQTQACFKLEPHHAAMYNKACLMKHRFNRFKAQCGIWLLHMLLSDLNTLLLLSPRDPLKPLARKFIPAITNMTGSPVIRAATWSEFFNGFFSGTPTAKTATAAVRRIEAMALVNALCRSGAVKDLDAAIKTSTIARSMFFNCSSTSYGETIGGPIQNAAEYVIGGNISIVAPSDNGGVRLRYTVT